MSAAKKKRLIPNKARLHKDSFLCSETRCPICDSKLHIKTKTLAAQSLILEELECTHCHTPINQNEHHVN